MECLGLCLVHDSAVPSSGSSSAHASEVATVDGLRDAARNRCCGHNIHRKDPGPVCDWTSDRDEDEASLFGLKTF